MRVLVQGLGAVGALLAQQLDAAGAEVLVSDVDAARTDGFTAVAPDDVIGTECDVYAPCAVGGTITAATVEQLRCSIVAGAANNQLAAPALADRLHERGILYAPDYVINSGGVLHGTGLELLGWDQTQLDAAPARPRRHAARALRRRRPFAGARRRGARRAGAAAASSLRAAAAASASSTPRSRSHAAIGPSRSRIASSSRRSVREVADVAHETRAEPRDQPGSSAATLRCGTSNRAITASRSSLGTTPAATSTRRATPSRCLTTAEQDVAGPTWSWPSCIASSSASSSASFAAAVNGICPPASGARRRARPCVPPRPAPRAVQPERADLRLTRQRDQQVLGPDVPVPHHPRLVLRDGDDLRGPAR